MNLLNQNSALRLTHADESSRIWHKRFGHLNFIYMQHISKKILVDGLPDIHFSKGVCEGCVLGKHPQEKFNKGKSQRASTPLDLIHSDLMGPFPHPSINKVRFFLIFVDDFSRFTWIYFLRKKSEVFNTSKISNPWLRLSLERKSKYFELITGESMSIMRSIIFSMRQGFICNTQFPILRRKTELLSGKIDL
jgi:hypothetical protein